MDFVFTIVDNDLKLLEPEKKLIVLDIVVTHKTLIPAGKENRQFTACSTRALARYPFMAGHRARSLDDRQRAEGRRMSHHSRTPTTESACAEPFTRWRRRSLAVGAKQRYARWRHRDGESRATATRRGNARMHEHLKEDYGVVAGGDQRRYFSKQQYYNNILTSLSTAAAHVPTTLPPDHVLFCTSAQSQCSNRTRRCKLYERYTAVLVIRAHVLPTVDNDNTTTVVVIVVFHRPSIPLGTPTYTSSPTDLALE
ncbi:hypothetical protein QTP88_011046 [Uroleucon formosanum]